MFTVLQIGNKLTLIGKNIFLKLRFTTICRPERCNVNRCTLFCDDIVLCVCVSPPPLVQSTQRSCSVGHKIKSVQEVTAREGRSSQVSISSLRQKKDRQQHTSTGLSVLLECPKDWSMICMWWCRFSWASWLFFCLPSCFERKKWGLTSLLVCSGKKPSLTLQRETNQRTREYCTLWHLSPSVSSKARRPLTTRSFYGLRFQMADPSACLLEDTSRWWPWSMVTKVKTYDRYLHCSRSIFVCYDACEFDYGRLK